MARRSPAADSTEGIFTFGRSSYPFFATALPDEDRDVVHHANDANDVIGSDSDGGVDLSSFRDIPPEPISDLAFRSYENSTRSSPPGPPILSLSGRQRSLLSESQPSRLSASQPERTTSTSSRPQHVDSSPRHRRRSSDQTRSGAGAAAHHDNTPYSLPSFASFANSSSRQRPPRQPPPAEGLDQPPPSILFTPARLRRPVNGADDTDNDYLELLGNNDFSSPSLLAHTSPLQSIPQPDRRGANQRQDAMPQTRRRAAAAAAAGTSASAASVVSSPPSGGSANNVPLARSANPPPSNATTSPSASRSSTTWAQQRAGLSPTDNRTSAKRRRGSESVGSAPMVPISSLLASIGGGSSSSQHTGQGSDSQGAASASTSNSQPSRPRISPKRPKREEPIVLDDDLFGSDEDGGVEVVNLTNVDRPQAAKEEEAGEADGSVTAPAPPSLVKIAALQCVICMDDMSNLTVTHCGHLFCGECLHSSLNTNSARRICPICRTKIEMRASNLSASKLSRSYFPLQLKMMSRNQRGKQPARTS